MRQYTVLFIAISLIFSSCEEVIDLKLDTTQPRLVIQGNIYDQPGPYFITLSQTIEFDDISNYPPVSNAFIVISDNHGSVDTLTEKSPGTYVTSTLKGTPGYEYSLKVVTENGMYEAFSIMPNAVNIDSIYTEENRFGGELQTAIKFKDPANIKNYYHVKQVTNNKAKSGFYTVSDELFDGLDINFSIATRGDGPGTSQDEDELLPGDSITVWLECVDEGVYDYFRTAGGDMSQSASPTNPLSNISNGAFGYFNACAVRSESMVVK